MALVTGPLHSDDASGRFADSLVFAKWKGRNYVRQLITPRNPRSAKQTGVRVMMKWLAQWWASISAPDQATWDSLAASRNISPFNAMVGENLDRWQYNTGPTEAYPAAETNNALQASTPTATGHEGYASLSSTSEEGSGDAVGCILFRGDAEPTPKSWAKAIAIFEITPGIGWSYDDSPLDPGTYHYKIAYFGDDGVIGALSWEDTTAVVT